MPEAVDEYRALLQKKQEASTSLASAQAVLAERQKELTSLQQQAQEKFGVSTLEQLEEMKKQSEANISTTVANVRASAPGLLGA